MHYEINVAYNGHHLFATAKRSITTLAGCKSMVKLFVEKFPERDGYHISVTRSVDAGTILNVADLLEA